MVGVPSLRQGWLERVGEAKVYETADKLEAVLAFMETQMPGFTPLTGLNYETGMREIDYTYFSNIHCYVNAFDQIREQYFKRLTLPSTSYSPCVYVVLYPNDACSCTSIETLYTWQIINRALIIR